MWWESSFAPHLFGEKSKISSFEKKKKIGFYTFNLTKKRKVRFERKLGIGNEKEKNDKIKNRRCLCLYILKQFRQKDTKMQLLNIFFETLFMKQK